MAKPAYANKILASAEITHVIQQIKTEMLIRLIKQNNYKNKLMNKRAAASGTGSAILHFLLFSK